VRVQPVIVESVGPVTWLSILSLCSWLCLHVCNTLSTLSVLFQQQQQRFEHLIRGKSTASTFASVDRGAYLQTLHPDACGGRCRSSPKSLAAEADLAICNATEYPAWRDDKTRADTLWGHLSLPQSCCNSLTTGTITIASNRLPVFAKFGLKTHLFLRRKGTISALEALSDALLQIDYTIYYYYHYFHVLFVLYLDRRDDDDDSQTSRSIHNIHTYSQILPIIQNKRKVTKQHTYSRPIQYTSNTKLQSGECKLLRTISA